MADIHYRLVLSGYADTEWEVNGDVGSVGLAAEACRYFIFGWDVDMFYAIGRITQDAKILAWVEWDQMHGFTVTHISDAAEDSDLPGRTGQAA